MPAFARTSVPVSRARDRRKPHDCGCGGKCGGCSSSKRRDERQAERAPAGAGHDFARLAIRDRQTHKDKDSGTVCNREEGKMDFEIHPACASKCVEIHEEAHAEHRLPCCRRYSKCWKSASTQQEKQACFTAYESWMTATRDWSECQASRVEKEYLQGYINRNCSGEKEKNEEPGAGAGWGAAIGALGGAVGGAFLGEHLARGTSMAGGAGGVVGGLVGAAAGAIGGALLGFGIGHIVRALKYEDVSDNCCWKLKEVELWTADFHEKRSCPGTWIDCPFDADGKIINRPSAAGGAAA